MSNPVFRTAYEIVGTGLAELAAHRAALNASREAAWAVVQKYGAEGYRPGHACGLRSLMFAAEMAPDGFKSIGREGKRLECTPHKGRALGKAALADFATVPRAPTGETLASKLGYNPSSAPMDGYKIYWPTLYDFGPSGGSAFLHIPRQAGDGFEPDPEVLASVPESTLMLAMEAHNAFVRSRAAPVAA